MTKLMFVIIALVACLSLPTTRAQTCVGDEPPHYAHPIDCQLFYSCSGGTPILQDCGVGLWYNPNTGNCDWPDESFCDPNAVTTSPGPQFTTTTTEDSVTSMTSTGSTGSTASTTSTTSGVYCGDGVTESYPHPTECNLYYTCVGDTPVEVACPDGLWYNPDLGICDWPENVACGVEITTTDITTSSTSSSTATSTSSSTVTGSSTSSSTATSTSSSTVTGSSTSSSTATSTGSSTATSQLPTEPPPLPEKICPQVDDPNNRVRYAHETNCHLYYLCTAGTPLLYQCIDDEEFSPTHKSCYPVNVAGCSQCPTFDVEGEIVRLPHESVCHYYYVCNAGATSLYQCQGDLLFSRIDRACFTKEEAYCLLPNDEIEL